MAARMVDARLEDYINDKVQTFADFDALDSLIANVKEHQTLLQTQLQEVQADLESSEKNLRNHEQLGSHRAKTYQEQQAKLDQRVITFTDAPTPKDAYSHFDSAVVKLRALEAANGYVEMLGEVDRLSASIENTSDTIPNEALNTYAQLRSITTGLESLPSDEDGISGVSPALIAEHAHSLIHQHRQHMRQSFASDLEAVLSKLLWPKAGITLPATLRPDYEAAVAKLLSLQKPELEENDLQMSMDSPKSLEPAVLFPLDVLIKPLHARFTYHFSGDRPTNRPDKPEYMTSHVLELISTHSDFIAETLQYPLLSHFQASSLSTELCYMDATSALITSLLPMLTSKLSALALHFRTANEPQLLSHLVHTSLAFDDTLRTTYRYDGGLPSSTLWPGITNTLLTTSDLFTFWLETERTFALNRYEAFITDASTGTLDLTHSSLASCKSNVQCKPTKAAIRLLDLLTAVSSTYKPLVPFSHRLRFLMSIQIELLDTFHARLRSGLDAYLAATSAFARAASAVPDPDSVKGVQGLDRICRILGSADYIERALRDWSDEAFYLDMWTELQARTSDRPADAEIAGELNVGDVAERISSSLAPTVSQTDEDDDDNAWGEPTSTTQAQASLAPDDPNEPAGGLFDETSQSYDRLQSSSQSTLLSALQNNTAEALRSYTSDTTWTTLASSFSSPPSSPTSSLSALLKTLSSQISFLSKALGTVTLRQVTTGLTHYLEQRIIDKLVYRARFTHQGGLQFATDISAIDTTIADAALSPSASSVPKLREVAFLLSLPPKSAVATGEDEMTAWDDNDDDDNDDNNNNEAKGSSMATDEKNDGARDRTLEDVDSALFASNESARSILADMGFRWLGVEDARAVLQRRVEVG